MKRAAIFAAIGFLLHAQAVAGGTAIVESRTPALAGMPAGTSRSEVKWQDADTLRFQSVGEAGYAIIRDGSAYSVMESGGRTRVLDLSSMRKMMQSGGSTDPGTQFPGSIETVERTGESETVAGIDGEVFRVTHTDPEEKTVTAEWVLTGDPPVTELTRAYFGALEAIIGGDGAPTVLDPLDEALPDDRMGLLRVGDEFRVVSVSDEDPPAEAFALPAEPVDFGELMQGQPAQ